MTSQQRHRSRGSLSILNQIRSLSRTGSRHGVHERSTSSMSCNPHRQPPPSPGPLTSVSPITADGLIRSPTTALPKCPSTFETPPPPYEKVRSRPKSWLSIPNAWKGHTARSKSLHLPRHSVSGSIISGPVLTGTTNVKIAEAEGVKCEDPQQLTCEKEEPQQLTWEKQPKRFSDIVRTISKKRPESMDITTDNRMLSVEKGIARRRAETVNLCREKINKLTGHGHIKRKSIAESSDPPLLSSADNFIGIDSSSEFGFGSLSRSFASAVDKLDFHTQPTMGLTKSTTSFFNFRKRDKEKNEGKKVVEAKANVSKEKLIESDQQINTRDYLIKSNEQTNSGDNFIEANQQANDEQTKANNELIKESINASDKLITNQQTNLDDELTLRELLAETARNRSYYPRIAASDPEPQIFDARTNNYIPADPVANYPRGVNPLRMHTNPMEFATAPPGVVLPNPQITNRFPPIEEDEDVIEDAPIYSPSSGDLSQYNRLTPVSAPTVDREIEETPTRMPQKGYMQRLGLKKSRSGLGLFGRSKDENQKLKKSRSMHFGLFRKEEVPPIPERFLPTTPSPLRTVVTTPEPRLRSTTPLESVKRRGVVGMPVEDEAFMRIESFSHY